MNRNSEEQNKFRIQSDQYQFPYHWLPILDQNQGYSLGRGLIWGLEYLTYMDAVRQMIESDNPNQLLDVGCGDGRLLNFLGSNYFERYEGIDLSKDSIVLAQVLNRKKCFFDIEIGKVRKKFDLVVLLEVLEHIPEVQITALLKSVGKRLGVSGKVLICVPSVHNQPVPTKHYRHYTLKLLTQQLQRANLQICETHFVYKNYFLTWLIAKFSHNRFFTLNQSVITRLLWRAHQKTGYWATEHNAKHIIVLAQQSQALQ